MHCLFFMSYINDYSSDTRFSNIIYLKFPRDRAREWESIYTHREAVRAAERVIVIWEWVSFQPNRRLLFPVSFFRFIHIPRLPSNASSLLAAIPYTKRRWYPSVYYIYCCYRDPFFIFNKNMFFLFFSYIKKRIFLQSRFFNFMLARFRKSPPRHIFKCFARRSLWKHSEIVW